VLNNNLESIYYVKRISHELSIRTGQQGSGRLPKQRSLPSSQEADGDVCWQLGC
jgi:hypothetical protein